MRWVFAYGAAVIFRSKGFKVPKKNKTSSPQAGPSSKGAAPIALSKAPQPSVDRIDELAGRILSGDILLPKFQRDFVWEKDQILDLLDSIARNYPVGSILLWQSRQELRSENRIGDLAIKLPKPDYPVNYLLDGQQRLSSVCGALFWKGDDPDSRWNIAYDLRELRFIHLETLDDPPLHQIKINKIPDASEYFKHVSSLDTLAASDKDELKAAADELFKRFKDYKIATVTLGDMSIQDVAPIFERINSKGTPLTIVDLMRAATWSPEFDLIDSIDEIVGSLNEKNFGGIERKAILRNISAAAGGGFSADSIDNLRRHSAEKLKQATAETKEAYKRAVDFMSTQLHIPSDEIIPYVNQMVVLAEVFRRLPNPSAEQYKAIREWFWRSGISGYFSGWNTGMMATDLEAVKSFAENKTAEMVVSVDKQSADQWRIRNFRTNNAHSKILVMVLAAHEPLDLLTGQRIDVSSALAWSNTKEIHHFFPQRFLRDRGVPSHKINSLANCVILTSISNKTISDKAPSIY